MSVSTAVESGVDNDQNTRTGDDMALTAGQKQEVQALLEAIDRLSGLLAAEKLHLAELERRQAAGNG